MIHTVTPVTVGPYCVGRHVSMQTLPTKETAVGQFLIFPMDITYVLHFSVSCGSVIASGQHLKLLYQVTQCDESAVWKGFTRWFCHLYFGSLSKFFPLLAW